LRIALVGGEIVITFAPAFQKWKRSLRQTESGFLRSEKIYENKFGMSEPEVLLLPPR
jgi:hypothetical protein